jgi:hypothetical protein
MVDNQLLLKLDPPLSLCTNPPVPYQGQSGSLEDHSNRGDHHKKPKLSIVIAGHLDVQSEGSYSRSFTWLVKRTIIHRTYR